MAEVEPVIEAEVIEEPADVDGGTLATEVRALPVRRTGTELESWRGEVRAIAVVAAGGLAAGVVTVAAVSAARSRSGGRSRALRRVGGNRDGVVASRSFLVDVHLLGR
ncbi:MAG: hypothetical protein H0V25_11470 [Solirubrobacterales bacterium]|nr:hypothetical protein [Solirubrobacterales bacterium]